MTKNDESAITATCLDYFEGWYEADAARMERALHPELVKRSPDGEGGLEPLSARWMIDATARGQGRRDDPDERRVDITVEHVYGDIANVTVMSVPYAEYLQLVRTSQGWRIAHALWQPR
jgi:hypothetical protein